MIKILPHFGWSIKIKALSALIKTIPNLGTILICGALFKIYLIIALHILY